MPMRRSAVGEVIVTVEVAMQAVLSAQTRCTWRDCLIGCSGEAGCRRGAVQRC